MRERGSQGKYSKEKEVLDKYKTTQSLEKFQSKMLVKTHGAENEGHQFLLYS